MRRTRRAAAGSSAPGAAAGSAPPIDSGEGNPRAEEPCGAWRQTAPRCCKRPGASVGVLAGASGIARLTLYNLLSTLTERGELVKRGLPSGGSGYALATPVAGGTVRGGLGDVPAAHAQATVPAGTESH